MHAQKAISMPVKFEPISLFDFDFYDIFKTGVAILQC